MVQLGSPESTSRAPISPSQAAPIIFSDLRVHEETGDVLGTELSLRGGSDTRRATFQTAEGALLRCDTLDVKYVGDTISLILKPDSGWLHADGQKNWVEISSASPLNGTVVRDTLRAIIRMRWPSGQTRDDSLNLPRRTQPFSPDCVGISSG
jgi:hypothetical protein